MLARRIRLLSRRAGAGRFLSTTSRPSTKARWRPSRDGGRPDRPGARDVTEGTGTRRKISATDREAQGKLVGVLSTLPKKRDSPTVLKRVKRMPGLSTNTDSDDLIDAPADAERRRQQDLLWGDAVVDGRAHISWREGVRRYGEQLRLSIVHFHITCHLCRGLTQASSLRHGTPQLPHTEVCVCSQAVRFESST